MPTGIPAKLRKIADDITTNGCAPITRLTVLKKWFEQPGRMPAFAVWMARRAIKDRDKSKREPADLFRQADRLLKGIDPIQPRLTTEQKAIAQSLYRQMYDFQKEYRNVSWTGVREIENWQLLLVEQSLAILTERDGHPSDAYQLVANFCRAYDSRYPEGLVQQSRPKILALSRWMDKVEDVLR